LQSTAFRGLGEMVSCAKTGGPILTIYMMCDVLLYNEVPFEGRNVTAPNLGSKISQKNLHLGCE